MWMVGYNEGVGGGAATGGAGGDHQLNMVVDHSFNGRKLRPLMPRLMTSPNYSSPSTTTTTPCLTRSIHHGNDFFSQYHHHHLLGEQNKRDNNNQFNAPTTPVVVSSSRWNPTPEQLRALEELYRRGTRTPSAEQIQHITAQLRRFGKIEGKNVFYWFQNHKARERQKRRRQMESSSASDHHHHQGHNNNNHRDYDALEKKEELAASRTVLEVEQNKNWAPSTNCSALAEESVSIQRAAKAGGAECRPDGWLQFEEGELQQRRNFMERNATWQMLHHPPCPAPPAPVFTHLINTLLPNNNAIMATTTTTTTMDPKLIKNHDLSFFISTQRRRENGATSSEDDDYDDNCLVESQTTLQLFPLRSGDDNISNKETEISASAVNANINNLTPSQFFEFLPLKN